jgi:hypothetical protein
MRKDSKLYRAAASLSPEQIAVRIALLEGRACLLGALAIMPHPLGWTVHGIDDDAEEHQVFADLSACSCKAFRFRGGNCKHVQALRRWLKQN